MNLVQNFPFMNIIMCLASGVISSVLPGKKARVWTLTLLTVLLAMSGCVLAFVLGTGEPYVYMMGHFPAPWGNEIRVGILEGVMAVVFCLIMLLSVAGGGKYIARDIAETKQNLFYVLVNLMMSSLLALIYTNDMFTAYVFIEINTIAAGGLILIRETGHTLVAATKYMIMSLIGSGLILIGISMLYGITGHLLMSNMKETVAELNANGQYTMRQVDIRRMIAYSSVAQIGYIYMGIGIGTKTGMLAAIFHIISHAASKSMLFIAARGLSEVSDDSKLFEDLKGAGYRNVAAGVGFAVGALSMVGIPLFAGFTSKVYFAMGALEAGSEKMWVAMIALAISTILNAVYFLHTVMTIYTPAPDKKGSAKNGVPYVAAILVFVGLNLFLGIGSNLVWEAIAAGVQMFS